MSGFLRRALAQLFLKGKYPCSNCVGLGELLHCQTIIRRSGLLSPCNREFAPRLFENKVLARCSFGVAVGLNAVAAADGSAAAARPRRGSAAKTTSRNRLSTQPKPCPARVAPTETHRLQFSALSVRFLNFRFC